MMKRRPPYTPVNEMGGTIVSIGADVQNFKVGDRVFGTCISGGMAEYATAAEEGLYLVPEGVSMDTVAGFEVNYGTTYHGLVDLAKLKKDEVLLVLGASGGVGMAAIDIGKACGATVIACASNQEKMQMCLDAGADVVINYVEKDLRKELKRLEYDGSVDVVYDPVGGKWSEPSIKSLGLGGRFLVVGFASGGATPKDAIPKIPLNLALLNERQILGVFWGHWKAMDGNEQNTENIAVMMKWIAEGKLKPLVSKVYDFSNYMEAFEAMMGRKVVGKIVIKPVNGSAKM
jgi:NADPH2:quinone reductase